MPNFLHSVLAGCLDPDSPFYDGSANVASGKCGADKDAGKEEWAEDTPMPFGGLFERCTGPDDLCYSRVRKNPATGRTSCPIGYKEVPLLPEEVRSNNIFYSILLAITCG